jgi:hypothetical protein
MNTAQAIEKLTDYAKGNKTWNEIAELSNSNYSASIKEDGILVISYGPGFSENIAAKFAIDNIKSELCGMSILDRKIEKINSLLKEKTK